jgi:hypothetical protein
MEIPAQPLAPDQCFAFFPADERVAGPRHRRSTCRHSPSGPPATDRCDDTLANLTGNWPSTGLLEWDLANYAENDSKNPVLRTPTRSKNPMCHRPLAVRRTPP